MPPPVEYFWETTDLVVCILSLLPWQNMIAVSHVNRRLRREAQIFANSRINGLLTAFMPHDWIVYMWDQLDVSGAAITGELPLALLTRGPSPYKPMGSVLEFVVPLGEVSQLLQLFRRIGYKALKNFPAHVNISTSTGLAQVYCLQKKDCRNPSNVCTLLSPNQV